MAASTSTTRLSKRCAGRSNPIHRNSRDGAAASSALRPVMPMRARTMYTYHGELAVQGCRPTAERHGEQRDGTMYTSTR
ncbi:hypothetical protein OsI_32897 [Oryza sativa Indica Group]|uniref:Uncharacterized protein n=1 Tax=Oryza sativa subsp. indica TaxID=39946 RepID=B8BFY8_ORYSI|nr:hypothetical protein OsI_32897 [Oryza sativa Indica Group]